MTELTADITRDIQAISDAYDALRAINDPAHLRAALFWLVDKFGYPQAARVMRTETRRTDA